MQGLALVFFALFGLVLAGMYLSIRRNWLQPSLISGGGVLLSIILMTLFSLAQNTILVQAIVVGILLGGLFSGATLAAAWYFHGSEMRTQAAPTDPHEQQS